MTLYRIVALLTLVAAAALTAGAAYIIYGTPGATLDGEQPLPAAALPPSEQPVMVTVDAGESPADIGRALEHAGVIRSGRLFEVLVGVTGVQDSLEAGDYEFEGGMATIETVHRIAEGRTASRTVTLQEGLRVEEMGEILEKNGIVTKQQFLDALVPGLYDVPFLKQVQTSDLQGYLFPARYEFNRKTSAQIVVETLLRGFQTNVADTVQLEGQDLSFPDVITLASIVEREAVVAEERPIIASVFLNRIRAGIALQADPTVQYALTSDAASVERYGYWKRDLTLDDLKIDSAYNTYVNPGLPPGPIANPGLSSIEAVIRPAQTNYLFFVAKGDGTGEHVFAETLAEHLQNVERYQQ